jgi:DNA-binding transcriptional LysR family regulator
MSLNLHHLRSFALVVRSGGIGVAARASGVSQPALSRTLRELERSVGVQLLERGPRGLRLTLVGRALFEHAQTIVGAEREAERVLGAAAGLQHGILHVGASTTIATYLLPAAIARFANEHPGVEIRLIAAHTRLLEKMLRRYQVDLALAEAPPNDPRIVATPWMSDELVVIASPDHPLATKRGVPPTALSGERFVLRELESGTRDIVLRGLAAAGIVPQSSIAVDGTEVIKQLVVSGFGIAVVSRHAVVDQLLSKQLCMLDVPALRLRRPFTRLTLPGAKFGTDAADFFETLRALADQRVGQRRTTRASTILSSNGKSRAR